MFTCGDSKGGVLSSQALKMLYKPHGAVYIPSYKEPLDQIARHSLFSSEIIIIHNMSRIHHLLILGIMEYMLQCITWRGGGKSHKPKLLRKSMKQTRGFLEGLITKKITSLGEEWIFSAMTHLNKNCTGQSFCFKLTCISN